MRREALFDRVIQIIMWSVIICGIMVAIFIGFIINIIAISVMLPSRRGASMGAVTIQTGFIGPVTIGSLNVGTITIRMTTVWIAIAITVPSIKIGAVWSIVIWIIIGRVRLVVVRGSFQSLLQDRSDWFVLSQWDGDPAMVIVYTGSVSRVSVNQGLFVGNHFVQLLELPLLPSQFILHDFGTSGRRTHVPPPLVTFFSFSAEFAPLLAGPVLASLPAVTPAGAPAATLGAPLSLLSALASPVVAAFFTVSLNAEAASPFQDTPKLVFGWTPAPTATPGPHPTWTPTPTSAPTAPMSGGIVITSADTCLDVLRSKIFHHSLQLFFVRFFLSAKSAVKRIKIRLSLKIQVCFCTSSINMKDCVLRVDHPYCVPT